MSDWKCPLHNQVFKSKRSLAEHRNWDSGALNKEVLKGINKESRNGMWKGDRVNKGASLHEWIKNHKPKPYYCENNRCTNLSYDLANISQEYKRDINDFEWLCRRCHMLKDNRMNNLKQYRRVVSI